MDYLGIDVSRHIDDCRKTVVTMICSYVQAVSPIQIFNPYIRTTYSILTKIFHQKADKAGHKQNFFTFTENLVFFLMKQQIYILFKRKICEDKKKTCKTSFYVPTKRPFGHKRLFLVINLKK